VVFAVDANVNFFAHGRKILVARKVIAFVE
jgi:hypothetical protein